MTTNETAIANILVHLGQLRVAYLTAGGSHPDWDRVTQNADEEVFHHQHAAKAAARASAPHPWDGVFPEYTGGEV